MRLSTVFSLSTLAASTFAQLPAGVLPPPLSVGQNLTIAYGENVVSPPGELIPRGDTANPPTISSPVWTTSDQAMLFMVDLDVPRNGTRVTLVHWLVPNVTKVSRNSSLLVVPNPGPDGPGAPYLQPSPPVGDIPHRYVFLLFPLPEGYELPAALSYLSPPASTAARIGTPLPDLLAAAGLESTQPLAANYIRVQNLTGAAPNATATYPPYVTATGVANGSVYGGPLYGGPSSGDARNMRASFSALVAALAIGFGCMLM